MKGFGFKDQEDFDRIKDVAEKLYESLEPAHCPYFGEKVAFNAKGIRHLKFKSDGVARSKEDQYPRLKLLKYVSEILKQSKTLQGIKEINLLESQKTNKRWEKALKSVIFYEFIAVMDHLRIKVIIKEILGGEKHFWSVIPFWKVDRENSSRVLHSGSPESD